jgi:hypothetical protein
MTQASKLKAVIRTRAAKTGETYTTARRHVLAARPAKPATRIELVKAPPRVVEATAKPEAAKPARDPRVPRGELSDKTSRKSTGHGLEHWFKVLDAYGKTHGHTKAADHLYAEHKVQGWHAQMITVTWERARGLRQENQSCTGTFQVSVSRTLETPVDWVVAFFNDPVRRKAWLKGAAPALRESMEAAFAAGKAMELKKAGYARMRYKWLSSVVELRVTGKATGGCSIVADSSDLPDAGTVPVRREAFSAALDGLRDIAGASKAARLRPGA